MMNLNYILFWMSINHKWCVFSHVISIPLWTLPQKTDECSNYCNPREKRPQLYVLLPFLLQPRLQHQRLYQNSHNHAPIWLKVFNPHIFPSCDVLSLSLLETCMEEMISWWMADSIEPSIEISSLSVLWTSGGDHLWCIMGTEQANSGTLLGRKDSNMQGSKDWSLWWNGDGCMLNCG